MSKNEIKFGTDGWRSIIAEDFTFENVSIVSNAIGKFIKENFKEKNNIFIGHDTRFLARDFAKTAANEFLKLGFNVFLSESFAPTPVMAFHALRGEKSCGAIQFTASHNPPKYCGIKYITNYGGPASEEMTDEIMRRLKDNGGPGDNGDYETIVFNPKPRYFSHVKTLIDFEKIKNANLKIVYDPIFGAGQGYLDSLLSEAGCNVTVLHGKPDPLFGGMLPEPKEEFLKELKNKVKLLSAHVGIATDGDADRISIVDNTGKYFSPNKISAMLLRHLVKNKKQKGDIVRTLSTTHLLDHLGKQYGLKTHETKVGFKWICDVMLKQDVLIACEESGGISIKNHFPDKDAILAGMLVAEMLAYEKKSLEEIFNDTIKDAKWTCVNDRFDLHVDENGRKNLLESLKKGNTENINGKKIVSINTIEGVKYILEDGSWFFARASGTEPMARVYFEATSSECLEKMKEFVRNTLSYNDLSCQK